MTALSFFNGLVGIGTIAIIAFIVVVWIMEFLKETNNKFFTFLKKHHFRIAFLMALTAILGSLIYSEIFKFPPCTFCWWQRIFMYPQAIVLGIGIWQKDVKIWMTSIILSGIGLLFSIIHIMIQSGIIGESAACIQGGLSCAKIDVLIFGWITIPIMCLTLFAGILTFAYLAHRK